MDHIEYAYTLGMDDAAVEERLETTGTGVLSLADGDDSYAIPLAHYYDGDGLYFRLGVTDGSRKQELLETTDTACYVLYGTEDTDDPRGIETWSVLVTGRLTELPDSEHERFDTAEINEQFSPIRVFDEDIDEMEIVIVELEIESITGRHTPEA
ncbi:pyridoxamine 5'-phosphate oxidase family protein [Halobellus inordinatus]|uniref:pyridoxamine 5'-phosphate oxidase family protein n=1 Tax=Halobellus inordinatus TaxID=1126236 RepID=UPI00210B7D1D|nr:pyridoxamine 5'-phosphate oxidase family protein [Halobellus inordinatus]